MLEKRWFAEEGADIPALVTRISAISTCVTWTLHSVQIRLINAWLWTLGYEPLVMNACYERLLWTLGYEPLVMNACYERLVMNPWLWTLGYERLVMNTWLWTLGYERLVMKTW